MKAARFHGPGDIRIDAVPEPTVGPGQVKVDVEWCGICGTDLHEYLEGPIFIPPKGSPHPLTGQEMPVVMGHEFAGVISEVGEGVTHIKEGDRVAVEPYDVCGECAACAIGRYNICRKLGFVGLDGQQGGFAEKCVVGARWAHPLGDIPTELGALVEPLAVAYHAVRLSGIKPGGTAAVFGSGPIGLVTTAALKAAGAEKVVVVEPAAVRKAKAPGAGADVAFECAGVDAVLASAVGSVRPGGTVVNVAIWGHSASFAVNELVFSEINLIGTLAYCEDHPATIGLLQDKKVDATQFITGRIGLDDLVGKGFRELIDNKEENVKILVTPKDLV